MKGLAFVSGFLFMIRLSSGFMSLRSNGVQQRILLSASSKCVDGSSPSKKVSVLAFHGSEGTGLEFSVRLYPLREELLKANVDMQITALSAPFSRGHGYAWWTMAEGVRSFNADEYIGFKESADIVLKAFSLAPPDLVVGHSQGAILVAALLAQNLIPCHPTRGYILNGVAWPNPYGQQLFDLQLPDDIQPRILFVMGEKDTINPLEGAKQVREQLETSGCIVATLTHSGGHAVPSDEASIQAMAAWVLEDDKS
jgi:predicted esterase